MLNVCQVTSGELGFRAKKEQEESESQRKSQNVMLAEPVGCCLDELQRVECR